MKTDVKLMKNEVNSIDGRLNKAEVLQKNVYCNRYDI